jgi:universal stress protein A
MGSRGRRLRILVPVDFSETSGRAVAHAAGWAGREECELDIVHVFEHGSGDAASSASGLPHLLDLLQQVSADKLGDLVGDDGAPITVRHHIALGEPAAEIIRLSRRLGSHLVVMGATGSGSSELLLGTVAGRVAGDSDCPVVAVTTPGRRDAEAEAEAKEWAEATLFASEAPPTNIARAAAALGCRVVLLAPLTPDGPQHALARAIAGSAAVATVTAERAKAVAATSEATPSLRAASGETTKSTPGVAATDPRPAK